MRSWIIVFGLILGMAAPDAIQAQSGQQGGEQNVESCSSESGLCWPVLKIGARSEKVRTLQILLKSKGLGVAPDGSFGPSTQKAVRLLQKRKRLQVDGLVGWQTWEEVVPQLKLGARGKTVSLLQSWLVKSDYRVRRDGVYGPQTRKAVQALQKDIAILEKIDGIADSIVWCYLLGGHFDGE